MDEQNMTNTEMSTWQLKALTEALGDLTLTINDSLSVGRGSDNDVVLGSKQVSRNHALLSVLNNKLYIKDLESSNGTFINEQRIEANMSKHIKAEDTVSFADFAFQVLAEATELTDTVADVVTDANSVTEQPIMTSEEEVVSTVETSSTDMPLTTVIDTEVVDAEVIDSELADSESDVIEGKIIDAEIVEEAGTLEPVVVDSAPVTSTTPENIESEVTPVTEQQAEPVIAETEVKSDIFDTADIKADMSDKASELESSAAVEPAIDSSEEPVVLKETVIEKTVVDDVVLDEIVLDEIVLEQNPVADSIDEPVVENKAVNNALEHTDEPVVKETIVEDVLTSTETSTDAPAASTMSSEPTTAVEQEPVMTDDLSKEPLAVDPVTDDALMQQQTSQQEPVVSPEQDKTTTTALQEEADPDVLRARQAATGQFSGTANLGQGRDVGTQGNNAMDQALNNPADAGRVDKKPSGSWFIWVFIALVIIGLALWLFNIGGA